MEESTALSCLGRGTGAPLRNDAFAALWRSTAGFSRMAQPGLSTAPPNLVNSRNGFGREDAYAYVQARLKHRPRRRYLPGAGAAWRLEAELYDGAGQHPASADNFARRSLEAHPPHPKQRAVGGVDGGVSAKADSARSAAAANTAVPARVPRLAAKSLGEAQGRARNALSPIRSIQFHLIR